MKKILKGNKGFSLVELLIALLIMAVIAGTAITLFGGVLESSKVRADNETAESIKRAILTYINVSNDIDLSCLGVTNGEGNDQALISALAKSIEITNTDSILGGESLEVTPDTNDLKGTYGPFLEKEKIQPEQNGKEGWKIEVDSLTMVVSVTADETGSLIIK
ncbi:MAG: prepilin-type N-terminal cleavage/methylation domain-containing protein [Clostridiaceae bacterium]|nr:prepilin-type N-terminal cleavage/methylation domain-containing protein [Clostridiaceae bacterium]